MSEQSQTTPLDAVVSAITGHVHQQSAMETRFGDTSLINCPKCGRLHMRVYDCAAPIIPAAVTLATLRAEGWMVAVHNDYRLGGEFRTFWLLTHPCGRWIKGEGATDDIALMEAANAR